MDQIIFNQVVPIINIICSLALRANNLNSLNLTINRCHILFGLAKKPRQKRIVLNRKTLILRQNHTNHLVFTRTEVWLSSVTTYFLYKPSSTRNQGSKKSLFLSKSRTNQNVSVQ